MSKRPPDINYTALDRGAYCDFFAYECALPLGIIIMSYLLVPGKNSRFYIALFFEAVATALGIAGYTAFHAYDGRSATRIGISILVMIIVNLAVSILDAALKFHRIIHTFHLLLAHACLWIGGLATVWWYRDWSRNAEVQYKSWEVWSFISIWSGAMIAIGFPALIDYVFFHRGYLVPDGQMVPTKVVETADAAPVVPKPTVAEGDFDNPAVQIHQPN